MDRKASCADKYDTFSCLPVIVYELHLKMTWSKNEFHGTKNISATSFSCKIELLTFPMFLQISDDIRVLLLQHKDGLRPERGFLPFRSWLENVLEDAIEVLEQLSVLSDVSEQAALLLHV